jgi:RNA polymerase sigma factor (TIGR02999 family)
MDDITALLHQARAGDPAVLGRLFSVLYGELRKLARSNLSNGETLSPTVLIHEAYLRLLGNANLALQDRHHFLACAARAMRAIWIDHVRRSTALRRGGPGRDAPLDLAEDVPATLQTNEEWLALDQAMGRLDAINPRQREVVELRYFAGLEFGEIAQLLQCSERTAKREWERARAFLYALMH